MQNFNPFSKGKQLVLCFFLSCCMMANAFTQVFPVNTLLNNGNRPNRIIFAYLSDGYQSAELPEFLTNATNLNNALFGQSPFSNYKNFFNAYAIQVPSTQSGCLHPASASDEASSGGQPVSNPTTYFQSTFDYASIHRLLVPQNNIGLNNVLAANVSDYDQAFIVVNSTFYGGSGGTYATSSINVNANEVAIHEIGHSFGGLADEYTIGGQGERPNRTVVTDPATIKWKNWLNIPGNGIGIYPIGIEGWQRPHQNCKMQFLGVPFCAVCSEAIVSKIHTLINMVDAFTPASTAYNLPNTLPATFSVTALQSIPNTITVNWYLNGSSTPLATNQASVTVPFASWLVGSNTLRAEVVDNTTLSKSYLPGIGYINNLTWNVNRDALLPIELKSFSGKMLNKYASQLSWEIADATDLKNFILEKSLDGIHFKQMAIVDGNANKTAYDYTDLQFNGGINYYRLTIKEKNGSILLSSIVKLSNPFEKFNYKVYQDPAARNYHLSCNVEAPTKIYLKVLNSEGKMVYEKDLGQIATHLEFDFNLVNKAAGVYFANIQIGTSAYTVKLLAN
jgi:hypothetical protein